MCSQKQKQERGVTDCPFLHVIVKIAGGRVPWKLLKQRLVIRISSFITNVSGMQKTTETINIAGCLAVLRRLCSEQSYAQSTAKRTWFGAREVPNGHFLRGSTCQWSSWQPYRVNKEMPLHNKHESVAVMVVVHALTGPRVWFTSVLFRKSLIPKFHHPMLYKSSDAGKRRLRLPGQCSTNNIYYLTRHHKHSKNHHSITTIHKHSTLWNNNSTPIITKFLSQSFMRERRDEDVYLTAQFYYTVMHLYKQLPKNTNIK